MSETRRQFLHSTAAGIAAAPALLSQRNPNSVMGIASLGVGTRGVYLHNQVQECPNTDVRMICDLYDGNLERARKQNKNQKVRLTKEWEKVMESKDIDAVIIATPDFWHAPMAIRAAQMKKHIYVEKGLCRTLAEAKGIRKAVTDNNVVLQLGHNSNSEPNHIKAKEIYKSGVLGKTPLARLYIDRTNPWPEWQFYTAYDIQQVPKDANESTIAWERFVANAPKRAFDVQRFFRWRCWWEYGSGIAGDLMSHLWDGLNGIVGMGIPESLQTQGNLYFWKQDRDVPDMWHVMYDYPKQELAVTFACSFHNRHQGTGTYIFGRDGTLEVSGSTVKLFDAEWKPGYNEKMTKARAAAVAAGRSRESAGVPPDYEMKRGELQVSNHMQNWLDCIKNGGTPRCGMKQAWEEAVTIVMSVESYRKERKVKWDAVTEEIV